MNILVVNAGSSSLKYQLIATDSFANALSGYDLGLGVDKLILE